MYDAKATDVWALGITFTKIIGLDHPFSDRGDGDLQEDKLSKVMKYRIVNQHLRYNWDEGWVAPGGPGELIIGMLEKDPKKRWTVSGQSDLH